MLLIKFEDTGIVNKLTDSGDHKVPALKKTNDLVNYVILSQEVTLQTYRTVREILIIR